MIKKTKKQTKNSTYTYCTYAYNFWCKNDQIT